jgi:hypothetical protein
MALSFSIDKDKYPYIYIIEKDKRDEIINKIFDIGYNYLFNNNDKNIETINLNKNVNLKLENLETSINKLIGLSSSSMKKGEFAENLLENLILDRYGDIKYTNMAQIDHCGDAWLEFDNINEKIMLESKNYTNKVNKDELEKMRNDMIKNNIKWGVFISWNSSIIGYRDFDIDIFNNNGNTYTIILVSNFINNTDIIDIIILSLRKLIYNFNNINNFPWIVNNINNHLDELNNIITLNYHLRTNYIEMEKNIKSSMDKYYTQLREYQHNIDNKINIIINEIKGTMDKSIKINNSDFNYNDYLNKYKNNKKIFIILSKILDIFKNKLIIIDNNNLIKNNEIIGTIKIGSKKITLFYNKYNACCDFNIDNDNIESFDFLNLI